MRQGRIEQMMRNPEYNHTRNVCDEQTIRRAPTTRAYWSTLLWQKQQTINAEAYKKAYL